MKLKKIRGVPGLPSRRDVLAGQADKLRRQEGQERLGPVVERDFGRFQSGSLGDGPPRQRRQNTLQIQQLFISRQFLFRQPSAPGDLRYRCREKP